MNILRKSNLLLLSIAFSLQLFGMETDAAYAQLIKNIKALPSDIRVEIFKHKCSQLCPKLIDEAQTLPQLKELFKSFITLDKDFRPLTFFQSTLFKLLKIKKYKILCDIDQKLKAAEITGFDVVNNGIETKSEGPGPLHEAVDKKRIDIVELLIKNGANVNAITFSKESPLHWAIDKKYLEIAQLLIKNAADPNAQNSDDRTPLHLAIDNGDIKAVELLVQSGADINIQDYAQWTPLHEAADNGHVEIVALLIKSGANLNLINDENKTALDIAQEEGHQEIVDLLKAAQNNSK